MCGDGHSPPIYLSPGKCFGTKKSAKLSGWVLAVETFKDLGEEIGFIGGRCD